MTLQSSLIVCIFTENAMEWLGGVDVNATVSEYWSRAVDSVQGGTAELARILFEKVVLPAGQSLLHHTELAAQYTLNGDYEVSNVDPFIHSRLYLM